MAKPSSLFQLPLSQALPVLKALANERRCTILEVVAEAPKTITELAALVELDQATVSQHVSLLERVGLVTCASVPGARGRARMVHPAVNNILLHLPGVAEPPEEEHVVDMPIGLYTEIQVVPNCGFATANEVVYPIDVPSTFHHPQRTEAELIWLSDGFIEYCFPCQIAGDQAPRRLEVSAELCSEAYEYDESYPSDVTLWINDREVGTARLPGDMGARYGRLTPEWVPVYHTKYGFLTTWSVDDRGSRVNQSEAGDVTVDDLDLSPDRPIVVRFGFKEDGTHGGMNLFGARFGDHDQPVRLRLVSAPAYTPAERLLREMRTALTPTRGERAARGRGKSRES